MGIISKHKQKIAIILNEATVPNSVNNLLWVMIKVANPEAVVVLVISVAFPTLVMTRCSDFALFPCLLNSCWYLFMRKIQLGTPITMISGGINAVKTVISYSKNPNVPRAHATPTKTTKTEIKVALIDLKNIKNINEVTIKAVKTKSPISSSIF